MAVLTGLSAVMIPGALAADMDGTATAEAAGQPHYGGTLVWGTRNPPQQFNPLIATSDVSASLSGLLFSSLFRVDQDGELKTDLVASWDLSSDGLSYSFHLRPGVRFHDGVELTAEDVRFTYEAIHDPVNQSSFRMNTSQTSWDVVDRYTVRMTVPEKSPLILYHLVREILPRHLLAGKDMKTAAFNQAPVGSGPFRFEGWDKKRQEVILTANADYDQGRPYLDRIGVRVYPDNTRLWAALMRQEVDLVKFMDYRDYLVLENDKTFHHYKVPLDMYCAMAFDLQDPILRDPEMRRAIVRSLDKKAILAALSFDGVEARGPFYPGSAGFNPAVEPLPYDPEGARRDLQIRGWQDHDGDGVMDRDGRDLEIRVLVDVRGQIYRNIATVIRQQLAEVGIKMTVVLYDDDKKLTDAFIREHRPQAWLRFFHGAGIGGFNAVKSWYSQTSEVLRIGHYRNADVDRLFEEALQTDGKERELLFQKMHQLIYDDQPAAFLFFPYAFYAVSQRIQNTDALFSVYMPDYTMKDWYISGVP